MRRNATRSRLGWSDVAGQLHGDAGAAALFAGFDRGGARRRAREMPNRPETLILCFETAAGRRRRGEPLPEPMRRLTGATEARLSPGAATGHAAAGRLGLDQAYREFRDLDEPPAALPPPGLPPAFEPLLEPSRYKGAFGGRGSGKSH
ncbi:hypothetical protein, partial [Inquilinus sp. OTU3971]|uniref:hypothetical protein n=1 Tax=Inquilinus sp. OTU3971 TaxID=3043855 RepID=UPI00313CF28E